MNTSPSPRRKKAGSTSRTRKSKTTSGAKFDIYETVTDRILDALDKGTVPWRNPIKGSGPQGPLRNLVSQKAYRGINVFLLAMSQWAKGYESSQWLTFKQAKAKQAQVRKGEKSSLVVFWKKLDPKPDANKRPGEISSDDLKERFVLRYYNVFNAEQCDGLDLGDLAVGKDDIPGVEHEPIDAAERIVAGYAPGGNGPRIEQRGGRASYSPVNDLVQIPGAERFATPESYYATLFHELAHSTGHSSRLDRGLDTKLAPFGSADYSKEELVAEMGAAFLAAAAGISPPTLDQSAAYIDGWRKKLKGDKKLVIQAAGAGQRAADHILGITWDQANDNTTAPRKLPQKLPREPSNTTKLGQHEHHPAPDRDAAELLGKLKADLQDFPRPGQVNLNSTATHQERIAYICAVLGWLNDHIEDWTANGILDPNKNPTVNPTPATLQKLSGVPGLPGVLPEAVEQGGPS